MSDVALRLPPGVVWCAGAVPAPGDRAAERRAGREQAAIALRRLGAPAPPPGGGRTRFPSAVVGSVAHDRGTAAAAVARRADGWAALGIDLHAVRDLDEREAAYLAAPGELRRAAAVVPAADAPHLVFALKEAVFKAMSDLDGSWLEFADIRVRVHRRGRAALVRPRSPGAVLRWGQRCDGFTAAALVPDRAARRGSG